MILLIRSRKIQWLMLALLCSTPLLIKAESALACSCARPRSVDESLAQATAVFAGRVTDIESVDSRRVEVDFDVDTVWKGSNTSTISVYTAPNPAVCGYSFEVGRSYLVYARENQGLLQVNQCSRTNLLSQSGDDLTLLNKQDSQPRSTRNWFDVTKWLRCKQGG